jgi:hypothetical protein
VEKKPRQTRWLFSVPIRNDWAFWLWIGVSGLAVISRLAANLTNDALGVSTLPGLVSGVIDGAFTVFGNLFIWYLISLIWLLPRRYFFWSSATDEDSESVKEVALPQVDKSSNKLSQFASRTKPRINSLVEKRIVKVLLIILGVFAVDQAVQGWEMRQLVSVVEASESIMYEVIDENGKVTDVYYKSGEWSDFDAAERAYSLTAGKHSADLAAAGARVSRVSVLPWHTSIKAAKADYFKHNKAWLDTLKSEIEIGDDMLWDPEVKQDISNTWEIAKFSLPAAVPSLDFFGNGNRIEQILK